MNTGFYRNIMRRTFASSWASEYQLMIYYLFTLSDGQCSLTEQQKFDEICEQMEVAADIKQKVMDYGKSLPISKIGDHAELILQELAKMVGKPENGMPLLTSSLLTDDLEWGRRELSISTSLQAQTVWTLINLGYADSEFSEPERKIVAFLADFWKMDQAMIADMLDTAETIVALTEQKEWIKTTAKPYDEISLIIQEIDKDIQLMIGNTETLIYEADIA